MAEGDAQGDHLRRHERGERDTGKERGKVRGVISSLPRWSLWKMGAGTSVRWLPSPGGGGSPLGLLMAPHF